MLDPVPKGYANTPYGQVHFRRVDGEGVPVILLHRTPTSSFSFERMLRLMAGKRAAVAFDTPGFGQSFCPPGSPDVSNYARWLPAAIDALDISMPSTSPVIIPARISLPKLPLWLPSGHDRCC